MPHRLILMRHAKSDHDDPSLSDHDRILAKRGRRDSPVMAQWIANERLMPDALLSSSSVRTRETAALMIDAWETPPVRVFYSENLYLASAEALLWTARAESRDSTSLMLLAHNPGIAMLASSLAGTTLSMPTAAIAVFNVSAPTDANPLNELNEQTQIELQRYVTPKSLGADSE